jgi:nifR3 family TIM-barrel protein
MPFPFRIDADVPLYLAPMAGVSESPFRQLCHEHGADVVVTEFLSAEGIRRENEATIHKLSFGVGERPIGVQIFGADPVAMGEAARFVSDVFEPEYIDINFGCPVKKVVRRNGGSGCLRDLDLVQQVIRAVASATHLPVTCKIRSGWNEEMRDPVQIALRCQDAGARVIALHPRTRTQMYTGSARWEEIAAVVDAVEIPVLGNGDIKTAEDAIRMHQQTKCAGIMIARGSYGQPWIFNQVKDLLAGRPKRPAPSVAERFEIALHHARMVTAYETDPRGAAIEFRKHLGWYAKGLHGGAELRKKLYAVTSFGEVEGIFAAYLANADRYSAITAHEGEGASEHEGLAATDDDFEADAA